MDKSFKTVKQLLASTIKKELEYEKFRTQLFEKSANQVKSLNLSIETKTRNKSVQLNGKHLKVDFLARSPFKLTQKEVFDDESPDNRFINDESEFQISILKSNKRLVFDFFSDNSKLYIRSIAVSNNKDLLAVRHFSTLDQSTQEDFTKYLNSKVPSSQLSNFIDSYSVERYDELYLEWLENIESLLDSDQN